MADLEELKLKLRLEEVAKHVGINFSYESERYAKAICPFHNDTDPSFIVDKISQSAKCFSSHCSANMKMDHVKLVEFAKHMSRDEAIDFLYILAGEERPISTMHDFLRRAMEKLRPMMDEPAPVQFFTERGVSNDALKDLMVGYSPSFKWFKEQIRDIPMDDAARLELYDPNRFDDAIIYPQFDALGRISGFRSRGFKSGVKYIGNSGGFPLKSSRLYGLHLVGAGTLVMVEGPNDVLALRSHGIKNVVGLNGTNTGNLEHFLTERGFSDVVFLADGDDAGKVATIKAPAMIRVNYIPDGLDPDTYALQHGMMGIVNLVNNARFPFEIIVDENIKQVPESLTGKIMLIKSIAKRISTGLPKIVMQKVRGKISTALDVTIDDVESLFEMVDYDTSDIESKIVGHLANDGPLSEDIKARVLPNMMGDPHCRGQYEQLLSGRSLSEQIRVNTMITEGDIDNFLEIAKRRELKKIFSGARDSVMNTGIPLDEILGRTMGKVYDASYKGFEIITAKDQISMAVSRALERYQNQGTLLGHSFGKRFPNMDEVMDGLRPNNMYVLAANQGVGKSNIALDWAMAMAFENDVPTLWFSLEMSPMSMATRMLTKMTGIPVKRIIKGTLHETDISELTITPIQFMNKPFYMIDGTGMTTSQIVAMTRKMKETKGIQAVFIDYLQLIKGHGKFDNMYERVGLVSQEIRDGIARDRHVGVPVIALAQLNKTAAKLAMPAGEQIAESYKVAQDVDGILTLRRRTPQEQQADKALNRNWGNMMMYTAKNREGEDGHLQGMLFNKVDLTFREMS